MMEDRLWYEEKMYQEEQEYAVQQERSHWGCSFFRHCWNEGLKLPTRYNCPECSDQYSEYRQDRINRRSVHDRLDFRFPKNDRRLKINDRDEYQRKRFASQDWIEYDGYEDETDNEYVWQKGQWCPPGLRKSQKRRV